MKFAPNAMVEDTGNYSVQGWVRGTDIAVCIDFGNKQEIEAVYASSYDAGCAAYRKESERITPLVLKALRTEFVKRKGAQVQQ